MAIINATLLQNELQSDADDSNGDITNAVNRASSFVQTYTSMHYYPWDDYDTTNSVARAPDEIVRICLEVSKAMYSQAVSEKTRDGAEIAFWRDLLDGYKNDLKTISVMPTWETKTIALNSSNAMLISNRDGNGQWTQVIPFNANIVSGSTNIWVQPDDWQITQGGRYDDEYREAWYLYAESSSVEGTLRYMRTYRNDGVDYGRFSSAVI